MRGSKTQAPLTKELRREQDKKCTEEFLGEQRRSERSAKEHGYVPSPGQQGPTHEGAMLLLGQVTIRVRIMNTSIF